MAGAMDVRKIDLVSVRLVREKSLQYHGRITGPQEATEMIRRYLKDMDREHLLVLSFDSQKQPLSLTIAAIGTLSDCPVHPREVFKSAILAGAAGIILFHNHPSGCTEASQEDISITQRLQAAGKILGIPLIDHIIIGQDSSTSLKNAGMLGE